MNDGGGRGRLVNTFEFERIYDADRDTMLAALRVVLGLPRTSTFRGGREGTQ